MRKLIKISGLVIFLSLLFLLFSWMTYLFRNNEFDKDHITGIKSEENNLDVIYIGGSAAFVYWEPLKAFRDHGFTSYDLASNSLPVESILPYIKYAEEYHDPELFVIGIRAFQYYSDEQSETGLRNSSDRMDLMCLPRYELIGSYLGNRIPDEDTDAVSFYFDIAKYHTNLANLRSDEAWGYIFNTGDSPDKGSMQSGNWAFLDKPVGFQTDERKNLLPNAEKELDKILRYCDDNDLNALFVVCPYSITKEHYAIYNTVGDKVMEHGYGYLNTNDHYEEMGIDFARDFYNDSHVNVYGAEKYTAFLEEYLVENYDLQDHRNDSAYSGWDSDAARFGEYSDQLKRSVDKIISDANDAVSQREKIRNIIDFSGWSEYVKDYRYSLILTGDGRLLFTDSEKDRKIFRYLGIDTDELFGSERYIKVIADDIHQIEVPGISDDMVSAEVGQIKLKSDVEINDKNGCCSIVIDGKECSRKDPEGLNIVVFDNYYRTVIDTVTLKKQGGTITVVR